MDLQSVNVFFFRNGLIIVFTLRMLASHFEFKKYYLVVQYRKFHQARQMQIHHLLICWEEVLCTQDTHADSKVVIFHHDCGPWHENSNMSETWSFMIEQKLSLICHMSFKPGQLWRYLLYCPEKLCLKAEPSWWWSV